MLHNSAMTSADVHALVFERLLRSKVPVALFSWRNEPGWPVEFVSPNVEYILGYSASDFLSGTVAYASIIHPDDLVRVTNEVLRNSAGGATEFEHDDYRIIDSTGRVRWVRDNTAIIRDAAGRATHFFGYILDDTVRHEALRARELAKQAAEASSRAKTEFLANVSHELRTPLTLILGPMEALLAGEAGPLPDRARRQLARAFRNAERLHAQVSDLLDYAKLEAGREQVILEPLDVTALVGALVDDARPTAEAQGIVLTLDGDPAPEWIAGDPGKLERIILNLLGNALKFTPRGGRITVSVRVPGEDVVIAVADTGPGIAPGDRERIFQRFEQGDASPARRHEGAGLGLSLSRALAELMGGTLTVESELGRGSRFAVRLPRNASHLASIEPADWVARAMKRSQLAARRRALALGAETGRVGPAPERPSGRPRLVLADDNADMREFMTEVLEDRYEVEAVASGAEVLAAVRRAPPVVVVCDVMMPGLDGAEVVRALKADPSLRAIPILLVTAKAGREEVVAGLEAGADDYIPKPFDATELRARVKAAERLHHAYVELAREHEALVRAHETLATTQRQLVQAGKLAAVGTLTAGISHELNNPLTTIVMNTQRLLRQADDHSPLHERLRIVERQALRCRDLVRSLLDFSREKVSARARVRLSTVLESVVQLARSQERGRVVVATEAGAGQLPEIEVSVQDLETALLNLVINALDATPPGGSVRISTRARAREGTPGVELAVTDEGAGIPDDILPRIFDPFFTTKPPGRGTGLGLALAQRIVHDAEGELSVESAPGRGTTMRVWLPSATPAAAEATR